MSIFWRLYWVFFALTLALYLVMVVWSLPVISQAAGGLVPFDMRPGGYSAEDARAFLAALSDEGRAFYLETQLRLDTAYPGMLAIVLAIGGWRLSIGRARWVGVLIVIAAIVGGLADYLENGAISRLLTADLSTLNKDNIAVASLFTLAKSVATSVAMTLTLCLLIWRLVLRLRRRKTTP